MNIEDLFLENMDQLYRTALFMLSNSLDAEDVVQETHPQRMCYFIIRSPKSSTRILSSQS